MKASSAAGFGRDTGIDWLRVLSALAVVVLHTTQTLYVEHTPAALKVIQLRDFGLRCFTLAMTFLVADQALRARPESWLSYAQRRSDRLLVPWLFWSVFYFSLRCFLIPRIRGERPNVPPWNEWILGPAHMYYLVFAFAGCVTLYGALLAGRRSGGPGRWSALLWFAVGLGLLLIWPRIANGIPVFVPSHLPAYLCWGVAGRLALETWGDRLRRPAAHRAYAALAVAGGITYLLLPNRYTLAGYTLPIFLFFVWAPPGWFASERAVPAAECTFGIYILHLFVIGRIEEVLLWQGVTLGLVPVLIVAVGVFLASWGLTRAIHLIPGAGRVLPGLITNRRPRKGESPAIRPA